MRTAVASRPNDFYYLYYTRFVVTLVFGEACMERLVHVLIFTTFLAIQTFVSLCKTPLTRYLRLEKALFINHDNVFSLIKRQKP